MSTEAIYAKYWAALMDVEAVMTPADTAIALALRLAVQDAYGEGSALAEDLAAIVASQRNRRQPAQPTPDQRVAESAIDQIGRLNEWLESNAPALYHNPDLDTVSAVMAELGVRERRMIEQSAALADLRISVMDANRDAASARQELVTLIAERDGLRGQLAQLDADNARLINSVMAADRVQETLRQAIADRDAEIDRLTRQNVIATDTLNSLTQVHSNGNGNGVDPTAPTTAPAWGRACPAWDGMTGEERIAVYDLFSGRVKFGELSIELRTEILARVLRHAMDGAERLTMARFDQSKPEWMPMASGLVKVFGGKWTKLLDLAAAPA